MARIGALLWSAQHLLRSEDSPHTLRSPTFRRFSRARVAQAHALRANVSLAVPPDTAAGTSVCTLCIELQIAASHHRATSASRLPRTLADPSSLSQFRVREARCRETRPIRVPCSDASRLGSARAPQSAGSQLQPDCFSSSLEACRRLTWSSLPPALRTPDSLARTARGSGPIGGLQNRCFLGTLARSGTADTFGIGAMSSNPSEIGPRLCRFNARRAQPPPPRAVSAAC